MAATTDSVKADASEAPLLNKTNLIASEASAFTESVVAAIITS
jgi:hypothetical protein